MKTMTRKLTALALSLLLCLLPIAVQAESLFNDRLTKAIDAGRTVEVAIGLELDDSLGALGLMPLESFTAVQELLRTATLRISVTQGANDQPEIGFDLRIGETPIVDGRAWLAEDRLAVTTSLLPGKTLLIDTEELFKGFQGAEDQFTALTEDFQILGASIENYVAIILDWANGAEGMFTLTQEATPGTPSQDASVQSFTLRVTPGQLKELLSKLTEEFMRADGQTKILTLNATSLEEIQALTPTDNVMEWTVRLDEQGGIASVDGVVPPMFEGSAAESVFSYQHFTANSAEFPSEDSSLDKHNFMAQATEENVGTSSVSLSIASDPQEPRGSMNILINQTNQNTSTIIALDHNYTGTRAADRETLESKTEVNVQMVAENTPEPGDPADTVQTMGQTTSLSAAADFTSETRIQGQDDFICESALGISIMGMPLGRVLVTLTSSAYVPADAVGNETVDLAGLDEAGKAALNEELNAGLQQAMALAMSQSPELLQLLTMTQE